MNVYLQEIIEQYPIDYCRLLEIAYGDGMMSEGGEEAIEAMFKGIALNDQSALEIGFGLGNMACYLAEKYDMRITALEVNPDLVDIANARLPKKLKNNIHYESYNPFETIPYPNNHFDIIYSKSVLTHIKDKIPLFKEFKRLLKPGGYLVITDWLSGKPGNWDESFRKMCEHENLILYPESVESYQAMLRQAGFEKITVEDHTKEYADYNLEIVRNLQTADAQKKLRQYCDEAFISNYIEGYRLIAKCMGNQTVLVKLIQAHLQA